MDISPHEVTHVRRSRFGPSVVGYQAVAPAAAASTAPHKISGTLGTASKRKHPNSHKRGSSKEKRDGHRSHKKRVKQNSIEDKTYEPAKGARQK